MPVPRDADADLRKAEENRVVDALVLRRVELAGHLGRCAPRTGRLLAAGRTGTPVHVLSDAYFSPRYDYLYVYRTCVKIIQITKKSQGIVVVWRRGVGFEAGRPWYLLLVWVVFLELFHRDSGVFSTLRWLGTSSDSPPLPGAAAPIALPHWWGPDAHARPRGQHGGGTSAMSSSRSSSCQVASGGLGSRWTSGAGGGRSDHRCFWCRGRFCLANE